MKKVFESSIYQTKDHRYFRFTVYQADGGKFELNLVDLDHNYEPVNETHLAVYKTINETQATMHHFVEHGCLPRVSYRPTRAGDWIVCAVAQATYGPGVHKKGSYAPGYTTGAEYGRYPTEEAAALAAEQLAAEMGRVLVEWQYPAKNPQFIDLPRLYPEHKDYSTSKEAREAGWIQINPDKTVYKYNGHTIYVRDVTPGRSQGYELVIAVKGHEKHFAASQQLWLTDEIRATSGTGCFTIRFRTGDVVDAIHAAREYIDGLA